MEKIAFSSDFFSCTGYRVDGMMIQDLVFVFVSVGAGRGGGWGYL